MMGTIHKDSFRKEQRSRQSGFDFGQRVRRRRRCPRREAPQGQRGQSSSSVSCYVPGGINEASPNEVPSYVKIDSKGKLFGRLRFLPDFFGGKTRWARPTVGTRATSSRVSERAGDTCQEPHHH